MIIWTIPIIIYYLFLFFCYRRCISKKEQKETISVPSESDNFIKITKKSAKQENFNKELNSILKNN